MLKQGRTVVNREFDVIMRAPRVLHITFRKFIRGFKSSQDELNRMNETQRRTLLFIHDKGDQTMTDLHRAIGRQKGSMTSVVDKLIKKGFVERRHTTRDKRKVQIGLTPAGKEKVDILKAEVAGHFKNKLIKLPPNSRQQFYQAIKILDNISRQL
jgi:DNA-binding MarR family transcriptional regulator